MSPFLLSLKLAFWTTVLLLPIGLLIGRVLAYNKFKGRAWVEALVYLPLVLPPTVLGYYLLVALSPNHLVGITLSSLFNTPLVFSFEGLVLASLLVNIPFAVQPTQQAFAAISKDTREAAWVSGLSSWQTFLRIELPQCWLGVLCAATLTFAHTLGEFGVVLMVGGNIAGETRTLSIAIYDSVQAFDMTAASAMTAGLLTFSLIALVVVRIAGAQRNSEH
ncbi:UNVERIFIED_CONTAM: hypothetical protein GTU68_046033 [Idotea baltica]|nr:hypothetical protein [Idotea baltica]